MFGNGAAINGMVITMAHRLTEVPGKLEQMITECSVAVPATAMRSIAVVPFVAATRRTAGGGAGVFAWRLLRFLPRPSFPREDSSLLSSPLALFPLSSLLFCALTRALKFFWEMGRIKFGIRCGV